VKVTSGGFVIAEADDNRLIAIEGNLYFPPDSVTPGTLAESATPYTCPWKGEAQYFDVRTEAGTLRDAAWGYPSPKQSAIERVRLDFAGYVAFDLSQVAVG
jgi:uncharacterized protein (DUF427 family)